MSHAIMKLSLRDAPWTPWPGSSARPPASDSEPLATIEDFRTVKFAGLPSERLTLERWLEIARSQFPLVSLGLGFLAFSDDELSEKVGEQPDAYEAFYDRLAELIDWNKNHIEMMQGLQARLLCALARNAEDAGEAAEQPAAAAGNSAP
jgi:hypothetical protein